MKRFSVIYLLKEQFHHVGCTTHSEAKAILHNLSTSQKRRPVGIFDAKTELFEWDPTRQPDYNQADIQEQGTWGEQIIAIAQSLRRRDSSWQEVGGFQRPSFFA